MAYPQMIDVTTETTRDIQNEFVKINSSSEKTSGPNQGYTEQNRAFFSTPHGHFYYNPYGYPYYGTYPYEYPYYSNYPYGYPCNGYESD